MTLRAVVVGLGAIGQRHARNLRSLLGDDLELCAVRSRLQSPTITDDLTIGAGRPEDDCNGGTFPTLEAALERPADVVLICTPTSMHLQALAVAISSGTATFVEKPLSHDLLGVDRVTTLAKERGVVVAVGCQLRFHPAIMKLKSLVGSRILGTLLGVQIEQAEYLPSFHPYEDYRDSYAARKDLGGGVLVTQIHELDYVHDIFGLPECVMAIGGRLGDLEIDVEDTVDALMHHTIDSTALPVHIHLDYLQRPPRRMCRVTGTNGTITVDLRQPRLIHTDNSGAVVEEDTFPEHNRTAMFQAELRSFLEAARGEHPPAVDLEHAANTQRLAEALRLSMETGKCQFLDVDA